jgi:PAS domain-containing protein
MELSPMNALTRDEPAASTAAIRSTRTPAEGLAALLDVLPVGAFVLDRDMHVRTMNPVAAQLVGWAAEAARGAHCHDVMRCVLCDDDCVVRRATATGRSHLGGSVSVRRCGGGTLPARLDAVPVGDDAFAVTLHPEGDLEPELVARGHGQEERIRAALRRGAGSVTVAARLLGVHRTTMWRWMAEFGLSRRDFRPG